VTERENIIALARECNVQSLKEPRYHMDIYELTGQAIEVFYHKAQREAFEQSAKTLDSVMVTDHSMNTFNRCQKAIRQLIKE